MSIAEKTRLTPEEYLAAERPAVEKHEFRDGEVIPMPGASRQHIRITVNLLAEIRACLRARPGEVYSSDMRVNVSNAGLFTYPDVTAVCEAPRFHDEEFDTLLNPALIVEVLSPSTEAYDRGEKFARYRRLESLREYVLVAQDCIRVERFARRGNDWLLTELSRADDVLRLDSIGCEIPLGEIYERVEFPAAGA